PFEMVCHFGDRIAAEFFTERNCKHDREHRFANDAGGRNGRNVRSLKSRDVFFYRSDIDRTKRLDKRRYRFQIAADAKFHAVRDAAFEPAGAVRPAETTAVVAGRYLVVNF